MTFSFKTLAIVAGCTLVGGFLFGFLPQHLSLDNVAKDQQRIQVQLSVVQRQEDLSNFTVRSAMIYIAAQKSNYTVASGSASSFFTDLRQYTDELPQGDLKQQLGMALASRYSIIRGLAKADPSVTELIQTVFLKMQSIQSGLLHSA